MMNRFVCWLMGHRPMSLKVKIGAKPDQLTDVVMTFCGRCDADLPPEEPRTYPDLKHPGFPIILPHELGFPAHGETDQSDKSDR